MSSLKAFLRLHRLKPNETGHTNTNMLACRRGEYIYTGKYNIPSKKYDQFIKRYFNTVDVLEYKVGFTEIPLEVSSLVLDLDLTLSDDEAFRQVRALDTPLRAFLEEVQRVAKRFFKPSSDRSFEGYLLFKKEKRMNEDGTLRGGCHIHFPDLPLNLKQKRIVRNELLDWSRKTRFFENLSKSGGPCVDRKSPEEIIDECVVNGYTPWMMYGSQKDKSTPYTITHVLTSDGAFSKKTFPMTESLVKRLSLRLPDRIAVSNLTEAEVLLSKLQDKTKRTEKRMGTRVPRSIGGNQTMTVEVGDDDFHFVNTRKKLVQTNVTLEELEDRINKLKVKYPNWNSNYNKWRQVGLIIHRYFPGDEGLRLFDQYSQNARNYLGFIDVKKHWRKFSKSNSKIKFGTLVYWLRS